MASVDLTSLSLSASTSFSDIAGQGWFVPHLVATCLDATDALRLAATCRLHRVVRLGSPLAGTTPKCEWRNPASRYEPHTWQSLQLPEGRVHTLFVKCMWRDQGWGNKKGMLSVVTAGGKAPNDYCPWGPAVKCGKEPAPHDESRLTMSFKPDDGERRYDVCARAGGGGGHSLHVRDFVARPVIFVEAAEVV